MTTTKMTTISRRTTLTLLFLFVASFLFGTLTVFVVQVYHANERFCVLFFFSIIFLKIIIAFWRLCLFLFFLIVGLHSAPLPARRRLRRVLSVCRGRSRFEGCFSRKFFFCFFFSTKTEDWREKWVLLDDVGRTPTTSSKLSFRGVRKILTTKMFVSLL